LGTGKRGSQTTTGQYRASPTPITSTISIHQDIGKEWNHRCAAADIAGITTLGGIGGRCDDSRDSHEANALGLAGWKKSFPD